MARGVGGERLPAADTRCHPVGLRPTLDHAIGQLACLHHAREGLGCDLAPFPTPGDGEQVVECEIRTGENDRGHGSDHPTFAP